MSTAARTYVPNTPPGMDRPLATELRAIAKASALTADGLQAAEDRLTTAEADITAAEAAITTAQGDIIALDGRLDTAESGITTLQGNRVLRAGDTMTGALALADGVVGTPALTWSADLNTGLYRVGADSIGFTTNGVLRLTVDTAALTATLPHRAADGSASAPAFSFSGDTNTGMFRATTDVLAFSTAGTERVRIGSGGGFFIGTDSTSPNPGVHISPVGTVAVGNNAGADGYTFASFLRNGTAIGTVTQVGTTGVNYNTTSDYRLKDVVGRPQNAKDLLMALNVRSYRWKAAPEEGVHVGFLAHEVAEVIPSVTTGAKDAVDEAGNIRPQMVDLSKLVPLIVAALQDVWSETERARTDIEALKPPVISAFPLLSRRQLRLWLLGHGVRASQVEQLIAQLPAEQREAALIEFQDATQYVREHPLIEHLGAQLGLEGAELDAAWSQAATL